jgi:hypothetical protein
LTNLRYSLLPLLALLAIVASIVVAPSMAAAQTAGLDQYQPNPGSTHHSAGGDGAAGPNDDGPVAGGAPAAGGSSGTGTAAGGNGGDEGADRSSGDGRNASRHGDPDAVPTSAGATEHPLGTIPFTDYPLTPLLLGVLLLLLAGLIAKLATYLAGRRRQPPSPV